MNEELACGSKANSLTQNVDHSSAEIEVSLSTAQEAQSFQLLK